MWNESFQVNFFYCLSFPPALLFHLGYVMIKSPSWNLLCYSSPAELLFEPSILGLEFWKRLAINYIVFKLLQMLLTKKNNNNKFVIPMSHKTFPSLRHMKNTFCLKGLSANWAQRLLNMFIKQAWRCNSNSGETVTNIDNTEKNKVSLNPLVTLKPPKQVSVQTRSGGGGRGRKKRRAHISSPCKDEKPAKCYPWWVRYQMGCHWTGPSALGLCNYHQGKSWRITL